MHHVRRSHAFVLIAILLVSACSSGSSAMTGHAWKWIQFSTAVSEMEIKEPSSYTVEFKPDGTFAAVADCNNVAGTYRAGASNTLQIIPGPATLAACGEGSLGGAFVSALASTSSYVVQGSRLRLSIATADADHFAQTPHGRPPTLTVLSGGDKATALELPTEA